MASGSFEDAARVFRESIAADPHFKALELLGECLIKLDRPREAIVPLAAASALNSQVRAPAMLAEALLRCGEFGKAGEFATRVLALAPNNKTAKRVMSVPEVKEALSEQGGQALDA
jgi:tetratricopeptide (TPR) repeat protein